MVRTSMAFVAGLIVLATSAAAMEARQTRVNVYSRGETIAGEEFVAANEAVVDYIATLARPSGGLERYAYECQVKSREIEPQVWSTSAPGGYTGYVTINTVYAISDCTRAE